VKLDPMKAEARQAFLKQPTVAKLATLNKDGSIRMTPIWFRHDADGSIVFGTWRNTAAARNIDRDPRCSVLIDHEVAEPYYGVHLQGTAAIEGPSNDLEGVAALYAPYKESLDQARKDVAGLIEEAEVVYIRFTPEREISWDFRE
jgi:PPOX class probable F420-dependent enzyme